MKIYLAIEIVYENEGNAHVAAFTTRKARDAHARKLRKENDAIPSETDENETGHNDDVLILKRTVMLDAIN